LFVFKRQKLKKTKKVVIVKEVNGAKLRAVKRLITSKIKVCVYIIYVGALYIIILYI